MVEAVVEFDYEAQQEDELSLAVGDVIVSVKKDDGGWWEGELDGRRGLFPDNFVREMKREAGQAALKSSLSNGSASPVSEPSIRPARKGEQIRKRRCKAAFSYLPQNEDELELKIGDVIEIVGEVEEGWWEGSLNGRTGMFPSNFTKELQRDPEDTPPSLDTPTSQEELHSSRTSKDSLGSESDGGESRSDSGSGEIQPKKVRGFGFGDIFKDQPIRLRPRSVDLETEGEKAPAEKAATVALETMKAEPDSKVKGRELCKVIFPYQAQNEDELTIKEGEIVTIVNKDCSDAGWWMGEVGGRQGVFPDNFVKQLIPDVEKERPKKPPPPNAPSAKHTAEKKSEVRKVPPERPEHLPQREPDRGEEVKVGDIPKPAIPSFPPKKPLPPKTGSSSSSSSLAPRRPDRPERPPIIQCESPKSEGGDSTPDSASDKSHDLDMDLDVIVSTEKLNHPTAMRPRITDRRPRSQIISTASLCGSDVVDFSVAEEERREKGKEEERREKGREEERREKGREEERREKGKEEERREKGREEERREKGKEEERREKGKEEQEGVSLRALDSSRRRVVDSKSALPPKPAVLPPPASGNTHRSPSPSAIGPSPSAISPSPSAISPSPDNRPTPLTPPTMEELRAQLQDLRGSVELLRSQHRQEMKQLASDLDEEKRIRVCLQVDIEHIKRSLAK